jgi:hypothetical protein
MLIRFYSCFLKLREAVKRQKIILLFYIEQKDAFASLFHGKEKYLV